MNIEMVTKADGKIKASDLCTNTIYIWWKQWMLFFSVVFIVYNLNVYHSLHDNFPNSWKLVAYKVTGTHIRWELVAYEVAGQNLMSDKIN